MGSPMLAAEKVRFVGKETTKVGENSTGEVRKEGGKSKETMASTSIVMEDEETKKSRERKHLMAER